MKKAFTIIEMLVVVVVIATLMTIVFRLSSIGEDSEYHNRTIVRMQKLENCLSGYHAAFGSYPPVKLHGTRDIYQSVGSHGIQNDDRNENLWNWTRIGENNEADAWRQVRAACKSQPIDCNFPFARGYGEAIRILSDTMKEFSQSDDESLRGFWGTENAKAKFSAGFDDAGSDSDSTGRFERGGSNGKRLKDLTDWRSIQLFRFGVMSFLLPRYLVMMGGSSEFFTDGFAQWDANNKIPCNPLQGRAFNSWNEIHDLSEKVGNGSGGQDLAKLANIPSQAICARWMPNLAGICSCNHKWTLFGVRIDTGYNIFSDVYNSNIEIFAPGDDSSGSYNDQYILDSITVLDGWNNSFYYYSPSPHQRYTLWSGGPNGRTFPPWISRKTLSSQANRCVSLWTVDDIIHLSN
jgi:prepilin-type N-terminal cleavage/methylation domain-containing protein